VPIIPTLIAGTVLIVFGTQQTELLCERATGTCSWRDGFIGGDAFDFPLSEVREVRAIGDLGRYGNDGHVELYAGRRAAMVFGQGEREATAARMTDQARSFFAGQGTTLHFHTPSRTWMFFLGGGLLCGALVMLANAKRPEKGSVLRTVAIVVAALAVGGAITTCVRRDDPGLTVSG